MAIPETWQDRILQKEDPTTMALAGEQPSFVQTRDPRYLSDAYQYYLNQGRAAAPGGITDAPDALCKQPGRDPFPEPGCGGGQCSGGGGSGPCPPENNCLLRPARRGDPPSKKLTLSEI